MHPDTRSTTSRCLAAVACLLTAACATNHPVHYYTLGSAERHPTQARPEGPTILVGPIATSEFLQDLRIHYRAGPNATGAYELHQWTERPSTMVRNGLVQALRASGNYHRVLVAASAVTGDYLLRGRLHEFEEVDDPAVKTRISLDLGLLDKKTNRMIWDRYFEREEPSEGKSIADVVASMDRNLAQVASQAAADLAREFAPK